MVRNAIERTMYAIHQRIVETGERPDRIFMPYKMWKELRDELKDILIPICIEDGMTDDEMIELAAI